MPKINPAILLWVREVAGLSQESAARRLKLSPKQRPSAGQRLDEIESGREEPARALLARMHRLYRLPLLVFYLSEPPPVEDRGQDFRVSSIAGTEPENALLDTLLRRIQARPRILRASLEDEDEFEPPDFVGSVNLFDGVRATSERLCDCIGLHIGDFRKRRSPEDAFKMFRAATESAGVFVLLAGDLGSHQTEIGTDTFRGYAIADDVLPLVVINEYDSRAAWSFTLLHELTHVFLGRSGVSGAVPGSNLESFCNMVAADVLLPDDEIHLLDLSGRSDVASLREPITAFARSRHLSSSMVEYKLYRAGRISEEIWRELSSLFGALWLEGRVRRRASSRSDRGPTYYVIRRHRIGPGTLDTVRAFHAEGSLSTNKAARALGVSQNDVASMLERTAT